MMDNNEPFVYNEVDYKRPKQSPQSSQTWPMDKIRQSRFQQKMSSLLSPVVTPKRNCNISNARSLLLKCLRDAKSDPLPRRRFPGTCSDEGILMDGVLVTSATAKKVSDSPSFSLGRASRSSIFRSQCKNTEFSSPRSESAQNQETTRSQKSSDGKGEMLASSPCTPKVANLSKLQASAEPFILTSRQASPSPYQQLPYDHYNPQFLNSLHLHPYSHQPRPLIYVYQRPQLLPLLPHGPDPYQLNCLNDFPSLSSNHRCRKKLPTTPSSSQPNTTSTEPPFHTPISTTSIASVSTSTTTVPHGSSPVQTPISTTSIASVSTSTTTVTHGSSPVQNPISTTPTAIVSTSTTTTTHGSLPVQTPISTTTTAIVSTSTTTTTHGSLPVQTPISTTPTAIVSTSTTTTTHGSSPVQTPISLTTPTAIFSTSTTTTTHSSSPFVDGLDTMTQIPEDISSASDGLETATKKTEDLSSASDVLEAVTQKPEDLSSASDVLEAVTQKPEDLSSASDVLEALTQKPEDLSSASDVLEALTQKPEDLSSASDVLEALTQKPEDLSSAGVGLETVTQNPELSSSAAVGLETMRRNREWSPSDDGFPTFTQDQTDFMEAQNRVFPDNVFGSYIYRKRMSAFKLAEAGLYKGTEEETSP